MMLGRSCQVDIFWITFSAVPAESSRGAHGRDPLWALCHLQVFFFFTGFYRFAKKLQKYNPVFLPTRRGPLGSKSGNRWFHTSDSTVKQVPFSEVSFSVRSISHRATVLKALSFTKSFRWVRPLHTCFSTRGNLKALRSDASLKSCRKNTHCNAMQWRTEVVFKYKKQLFSNSLILKLVSMGVKGQEVFEDILRKMHWAESSLNFDGWIDAKRKSQM